MAEFQNRIAIPFPFSREWADGEENDSIWHYFAEICVGTDSEHESVAFTNFIIKVHNPRQRMKGWQISSQ